MIPHIPFSFVSLLASGMEGAACRQSTAIQRIAYRFWLSVTWSYKRSSARGHR